MTYSEWAAEYPDAARALRQQVLCDGMQPPVESAVGMSEAWAQQQVRLQAAHRGILAWRNNVGATPSKCPDCGAPQRPVRYGLCNDSAKLNKKIKSSDLILAIPRLITPAMTGCTILQFGAVETKRPGWKYTGNDREAAQAAWLTLIASKGGYANFSIGELKL